MVHLHLLQQLAAMVVLVVVVEQVHQVMQVDQETHLLQILLKEMMVDSEYQIKILLPVVVVELVQLELMDLVCHLLDNPAVETVELV
jgi:hypothetical protein